jgi:hemoglobin/transferrin/lactoferrin receptor protein
LEVTGGVRYDHYDFSDISGRAFESDELSPNIAITVKPTDDFSMTIGHSEAYRGVGIREAFLPGIRPANLDGEDSDTQKVSFRYDNGAFYSSGAVFRQDIANYLYPLAAGGDGSFGDIHNEGYEFEAGIRRNGFHASLGVFHSDPETVGYAYPDDLGMVVAGRRWVADTGYTFKNLGVTVGWTVEIREAVAEVPLAGGGPFPAVSAKGAYTVNNLYAAWNVPTCDGLSATLNIDNILDEFYQDHTIYTGSGLANPGREVRLGLSYKF